MTRRPETDAARRVPRRVDDLQAAEHRDHVTIDDGGRFAGMGSDVVQQMTAAPGAHDLLQAHPNARQVIGMDEDLRPAVGQLSDAADMVGMPVRADDAVELAEIASDGAQVPNQRRLRTRQAGVDQCQALFRDQVRRTAAQLDRVQAGENLHGRPDSRTGPIDGLRARQPRACSLTSCGQFDHSDFGATAAARHANRERSLLQPRGTTMA